MIEGLILRLEAPLMSFGGVKVDQQNVTDTLPGLSLVAGLIANALGWSHGYTDMIQRLQDNILLASRWDIPPVPVVDYQTVDLGQPKMKHPGWTTRGIPEHREGGAAARTGIHQRYRHYLANGVVTSVIAFANDGWPGVQEVEKALSRPIRPLFVGRKTCLPSSRILVGRVTGENVLQMLQSVPRVVRRGAQAYTSMHARWPAGLAAEMPEQLKYVFDMRDWKNQVHTGSRLVAEGLIKEEP